MIDITLNIKYVSDFGLVSRMRERYSYGFRYAYRRIFIKEAGDLMDELKALRGFNDIEVRSLYSEVKMKFDQVMTDKANKEKRIVSIEKRLKKLNEKEKRNAKEIRTIFKLNRRKLLLENSLSKDITFGGKDRLKRIGYLSNCRGQMVPSANGKQMNANKEMGRLKKEYKNERRLDIYLLGEANQKGNRFFDFNFDKKEIIYKPKKGTKITFKYNVPKGREWELEKLKPLIENKEIAITVRIEHDEIHLYYDDAILSGYYIDKQERKEEVKEETKGIDNKEEKKKIINAVYVKYYEDLRERQLDGKNPLRIYSFDNNPDYIGCSILEKTGDSTFKIIYVCCYDLRRLNKKLPKDASAKERKRFNNRRKHEISNIWKKIFSTLMYFNCGFFISEDLDFKYKDVEGKPREANRKTKNIWHRNLTDQLIQKYTTKYGIIHDKINAAYTSTIGNLLYNYIDPINSAIEIGRRGLFQFSKDSFYPEICTGTIDHAMSRLLALNPQLRDVDLLKDCISWVEIHKCLKKTTGLRYRVLSYDDMCLIHINPNIRFESKKMKHLKTNKITFAN